jgi:hypothetical protein
MKEILLMRKRLGDTLWIISPLALLRIYLFLHLKMMCILDGTTLRILTLIIT